MKTSYKIITIYIYESKPGDIGSMLIYSSERPSFVSLAIIYIFPTSMLNRTENRQKKQATKVEKRLCLFR